MAKDPAFLFYPGDFTTGTQFLTDEQVGKYIRLLMAQHQIGHLEEKHMIMICKTYDKDVFNKFDKDKDGLYYNKRLEDEIVKRKKYTESRSNNRSNKNNISKSYDKHMENENKNIINNKERSDFLEFRKSEIKQLRQDIYEKLKKYELTVPVIYAGKKIPVVYYDLVEFVINCIDNDEWKISLKNRFGNSKFEDALKDFIKKLKTDNEFMSYESTNDFKRHFSNWLAKNNAKYL